MATWIWGAFPLLVVVFTAGFGAMKLQYYWLARAVLLLSALLLGEWLFLLCTDAQGPLRFAVVLSRALGAIFGAAAFAAGSYVIAQEKKRALKRARDQAYQRTLHPDTAHLKDLEAPLSWKPRDP